MFIFCFWAGGWILGFLIGPYFFRPSAWFWFWIYGLFGLLGGLYSSFGAYGLDTGYFWIFTLLLFCYLFAAKFIAFYLGAYGLFIFYLGAYGLFVFYFGAYGLVTFSLGA